MIDKYEIYSKVLVTKALSFDNKEEYMSLCPRCGKIMCDHALVERGQAQDEMMRDLTPEEEELWRSEPDGSQKLIDLAKKNAHILIV